MSAAREAPPSSPGADALAIALGVSPAILLLWSGVHPAHALLVAGPIATFFAWRSRPSRSGAPTKRPPFGLLAMGGMIALASVVLAGTGIVILEPVLVTGGLVGGALAFWLLTSPPR